MRRFATVALATLVMGPALAQKPGLGWIADSKTGCRIFYYPLEAGETVSWDGACPNGIAQGSGMMTWTINGAPGDEFHGELRNGRLTGHGKLYFAQGGSYDGDFVDSVIEGKGVEIDAQGGRYQGEWRNGEWNGRGVYVDRYGNRWEGEYRDGKLNGRGVSTNSVGARYEGEFLNDKAHGFGTLKTPGGEIHAGTWADGCLRQGGETFVVGTSPEDCGIR